MTGDPTGGGDDTSRTIDWVINDGVALSSLGASLVQVVHAAPTISAGGTVSFTAGGAAVVLDGDIGLTDPDSGGDLTGATISIGTGFLAGDILNFGTQNGIIGNYDTATGTLTLSGTATVANYETALASITYDSAAADLARTRTAPTRHARYPGASTTAWPSRIPPGRRPASCSFRPRSPGSSPVRPPRTRRPSRRSQG